MLRKATISVMAGVTQTAVPNIMSGGGGGESTRRRWLERIKLPRTIAPKKLTLGNEVLHRKTKRVKIDGTIAISSETTDIDKIFNYFRCN